MAMSFLPKDVLHTPIDIYYFLWAPISSACFNFKASVNLHPDSKEKQIKQIAYNSLSLPNKVVSTVVHFFTHISAGISLSIPILNMLPFGCLMIKAKEFVAPGMNEELNSTKIKLDQLLREAEEARSKPKVDTSSKNTNHCPEVKTCANMATPQKNKKPKYTIPPSNKPIHIILEVQKETTPLSEENDRLTRRVSGKNVGKMMNRFQNNQDGNLARKVSSPHIQDIEALKNEKELENKVVVNYFNLFPENSTASLLRKLQDKSEPVNAERAIIDNLILNFPGFIKQDKFMNANENLTILREYLVKNLGEKDGNLWIRETYSNDAQVKTKDNPFEIIRKGIFSSYSHDFLELVKQFKFEIKGDVIEVKVI